LIGTQWGSKRFEMNKLSQCAVLVLLRPYISRELPAWGRLYSTFVGDYHVDKDWAWLGTRWVRGKLHNYEMLLDMGQWSNRQTYFLKRLYDLPTQLVLQKFLKQGDTFIDIGANEGAISLLGARLVGLGGQVLSFEPNPAPRAKFQAAIDRNKISNIAVMPIGLGDSNGNFRLTAPKINSGEGSFGKSNYASEDVDVIQCEVRRGDDVLADSNPSLIKVDVEGFEFSVLKGIHSVIVKYHPPIVMEMISAHLANCGTSPLDVSAFMTGHGYKPFKIGIKRHFAKQQLTMTPITIGSDVDCDVLWV
jgi:FkbM family methyltransferase